MLHIRDVHQVFLSLYEDVYIVCDNNIELYVISISGINIKSYVYTNLDKSNSYIFKKSYIIDFYLSCTVMSILIEFVTIRDVANIVREYIFV